MQDNHFSRRYFFYGALLTGAIPAGGFGSVPSLSRLGFKSPNEKLNIASIGAGGKAESDISGCARVGENIVALCDPDSIRAARTFARYEKAPRYTDFRKMLDKEEKNIDAVIIATPDFMHGIAAMWSMERGKHVYVQKPMARTVWEARMLTEAARKYGVASQMGNQGYCQEGPRACAEMIWSGAIGDVTEVHAWTNRPIWKQGVATPPPPAPVPDTLDWDSWLGIAESRPHSPEYYPFSWRGYFDFGCGALGDMACHVLGAPNMALVLGAPTSFECIKKDPPGKNDVMYPMHSTIRFDFPARGSMPALKLFWHDGVSNLPAEVWPADIPKEEKLGDPPRGGIPGAAGAAGARGGAAGRGAPGAAAGRGGAPTPGGPPLPAGAPLPGGALAGRGGAMGGRGGAAAVTLPPGVAEAVAAANTALNARNTPYNTPASSGVLYIGSKGYMTTGEYGGGPRLVPMAKMADYQMPPQLLTRSHETYTDWIQSCKSGVPSASNFDVAGPFTEWIALGCLALRFEGKLEWDAERMRITNNSNANKYLKPTFRKGWSWSTKS
jgi:predicted dehydrogenase